MSLDSGVASAGATLRRLMPFPGAGGDPTGVSSEKGTVYLVKATVAVSNVGDIVSCPDQVWNPVSVEAKKSCRLDVSGLEDGAYRLYAVDESGNISAPATEPLILSLSARLPEALMVDAGHGDIKIHDAVASGSQIVTVLLAISGDVGDTVRLSSSLFDQGQTTDAGSGLIADNIDAHCIADGRTLSLTGTASVTRRAYR